MKSIVSSDAPRPVGPYSQAVDIKGFVFVSGQLPLDPKTGTLQAESIEKQTVTALENLKNILEKSGCSLSSVVKTTIFLTDLSRFDLVNRIYGTYFSQPYPARSCVEVSALPKGAQIEIEAIAFK
jgi:2-iminobutanoate/2-iminopropanoate deaminase